VCIVIVGGIGSISGVLVGALVMVGLDSLVLVKLASWLDARGLSSSANVISTPNNWKFMIFGLALVLMMRFRPEGLLPSHRVRAELRSDDEATLSGAGTKAAGGRA
jgi:branched-chain amino acid transport system permease protein